MHHSRSSQVPAAALVHPARHRSSSNASNKAPAFPNPEGFKNVRRGMPPKSIIGWDDVQSGNSRRCWSSGPTSKNNFIFGRGHFFFARKREKKTWVFFPVFWRCFCAFRGCFCAFGVFFLLFARQRDFFFFFSFLPKAYHTETGNSRSVPLGKPGPALWKMQPTNAGFEKPPWDRPSKEPNWGKRAKPRPGQGHPQFSLLGAWFELGRAGFFLVSFPAWGNGNWFFFYARGSISRVS